jgi:hypothetical protein
LIDAIAAADDFPTNPDVIKDHAARLVALIDAGTCPRCEIPLPKADELPAGSRVTDCRCIPICRLCGSEEGTWVVPPWAWPIPAPD